MKYFFVLILINTSISIFAQKNFYEIQFKISPIKNKPIYFGYHFGNNQYVTDTIYLNNLSEGLLKKENLPRGIYFIALSNMKMVNFIIDKPGQYRLSTDTLKLLRNLTIDNNLENEVFISYQIKLNDYKNKIRNIEARIANSSDSTDILNQQIEEKKSEWKQYVQSLITHYPNLFATKIIQSLQSNEFTFDVKTYFNNIDFADESLLFTPVFSTVIDNFFSSLPGLTIKNIDSLYQAIDYILMSSLKNPTVYEELAKYMISQFDLTGDYPNTDAFYYISDKYFLTDLIPWVNDGFKVRLSRYIQKLKTVTIGQTFPDLTLNTLNNQVKTIPEKNNKYSVIIFWNPECDHCIEYLRKLKNVLNTNQNKIDVYCILTATNVDEWKKVIQKEAFPWVHLYDKKLLNDFVEELFLYNTPQVFVIDKDKRIVAKDIMPEAILTLF